MSLTTSVALMAFILLAIIAAIPLYENYSEYSRWKKIYITIAVVLLFLIGGLDVWFRTNDDTMSKIWTAVEKLVINKKPQDKNDTIIKYKNVYPPKAIPYAFLRLFNGKVSSTSNLDSVGIDYWVINNGTGDAFKLQIRAIAVYINNGIIQVLPKHSFNEYGPSVSFAHTEGVTIGKETYTGLNIAGIQRDSVFFCYKLDYLDSTKKPKSLVSIQRINFEAKLLDESDSRIQRQIKNKLIKEKYWKPPFKQ